MTVPETPFAHSPFHKRHRDNAATHLFDEDPEALMAITRFCYDIGDVMIVMLYAQQTGRHGLAAEYARLAVSCCLGLVDSATEVDGAAALAGITNP